MNGGHSLSRPMPCLIKNKLCWKDRSVSITKLASALTLLRNLQADSCIGSLAKYACALLYWLFREMCMRTPVLALSRNMHAHSCTDSFAKCACALLYWLFREMCMRTPVLALSRNMHAHSCIGSFVYILSYTLFAMAEPSERPFSIIITCILQLRGKHWLGCQTLVCCDRKFVGKLADVHITLSVYIQQISAVYTPTLNYSS